MSFVPLSVLVISALLAQSCLHISAVKQNQKVQFWIPGESL